MNDQYLSKKAVSGKTLRNRICMIIGAVISVFFLLGIFLSITEESLRPYTFTYILLLIPFVLLFLHGLKGKRMIEAANRYNAIFICDSDGIVTISELTKQTGKDPAGIIGEIDKLLNKGYLCGCTLKKEGQPCVVLSDGKADESGFVTVKCPACGGTTRIRTGSNGKCEYCGGELKGY